MNLPWPYKLFLSHSLPSGKSQIPLLLMTPIELANEQQTQKKLHCRALLPPPRRCVEKFGGNGLKLTRHRPFRTVKGTGVGRSSELHPALSDEGGLYILPKPPAVHSPCQGQLWTIWIAPPNIHVGLWMPWYPSWSLPFARTPCSPPSVLVLLRDARSDADRTHTKILAPWNNDRPMDAAFVPYRFDPASEVTPVLENHLETPWAW